MSSLVPFWFIVIAILWTGFFILEGFDFGVGMLHEAFGTDDASRCRPRLPRPTPTHRYRPSCTEGSR